MTSSLETTIWPLWRRVAFRFAFVYIILYTTPWMFANYIPYGGYATDFYGTAWDWIIRSANKYIFTIKDELIPMAGSGDTSFGWAQLLWTLALAALGCLIWSLIDHKRKNYEVADYWLRLSTRYYVAFYCLLYGIIKLFALQMPFPNLSQLATPLGDFLPMRLSWMFVGYSTPYQAFSGIMEMTAGILLINRKTVTLGLLLAVGVFANVVAMNLSYDIPVKIFSSHLLIFSIFLLLYEATRLIDFFILNRVPQPDYSYKVVLHKKWMRYTRLVLKAAFIFFALLQPVYMNYSRMKSMENQPDLKPITSGVYDVDLFVLNKDTVPALISDTVRWQDLILDKGGQGSIKTSDVFFRQRYRRGYFSYKPDTLKSEIEFKYLPFDSTALLTMRYEIPDDKTIRLWTGNFKGDSLYVQLKRTNRHFQLAERQFHWLSEANR